MAEETAADERGRRPAWRRPGVVIPVLLVGAGLLAVAMYLFQPWKAFVDDVVDEALPQSADVPQTSDPDSTGGASSAPEGPTTLAEGTFVDHSHGTSGSAAFVRTANGKRVLRIEDLNTSNGPDLFVWLSRGGDADGDTAYRNYDRVNLGELRGNVGNLTYDVPADVNISQYDTVVIWCDRFSVSFGAADLR